MNWKSSSALFGLIALCALTPSAQSLTADTAAYAVTLASTVLVDDVDGLFAHTIDFTNKRLGRREQVRWTDHASRFTAIHVFQDRAALIGWVGGSAEAVSVVDLIGKTAVRFILCREPALSKDGRMLAFQQFVATHTLRDDIPSDLVLVSDLAAITPGENQAAPGSWVLAGRSHGTVVYPASMLGDQYSKPETTEYKSNTTVITNLQWLDQPRRLVFVARRGEQTWLAAVQVADVPGKSVVRERQIDVRAFMADASPTPDRLRTAEAALRFTGLEVVDQNTAAISIESHPVFARTRVVLPLPTGKRP